MASLICPHDGEENPVEALACVRCGRRLSRVEIGSVFLQRYLVQKCLAETQTGFRYLAQITATRKPCLLREIIPPALGKREDLLRFDRSARHLIQARPHCLIPVLEHFAHRSCYYTVEELSQAGNLHDAIVRQEPFSEQRAGELFFRLISGLKELYSLELPVYLGSLSPETILLGNEFQPVFVESQFIGDNAIGKIASAKDALREDLHACAWAVAAALSKEVAPAPQRTADAVSNVKDLALACSLGWILHANRSQPESVSKLEQFWGLIKSAESEINIGNVTKAIEMLEQAYHFSGSRRLENALHEAEKLKVAQATRPASPVLERPAAPPPMAPPSIGTAQPSAVERSKPAPAPAAQSPAGPIESSTIRVPPASLPSPAAQLPTLVAEAPSTVVPSPQVAQRPAITAKPLMVQPPASTAKPPMTPPATATPKAPAGQAPTVIVKPMVVQSPAVAKPTVTPSPPAESKLPVGPAVIKKPPAAQAPASILTVSKVQSQPSVSQPSLPPVMVQSQPRSSRPMPFTSRRRLLWFAIVAAVVIAVTAVVWNWASESLLQSFNLAISHGQLFTPPGESAYDFYQKAVQSDGSDSPTVKAMVARAKPKLQSFTDEQFNRWHEKLDLTAGQWVELEKAQEWLASMSASDSNSQARKEYAAAEVLYSQQQYSDALVGFQKALQRIPDWDLAELGVGDSCLALKRYVCAETYYTRAKRRGSQWDWPDRKLADLHEILAPSAPPQTQNSRTSVQSVHKPSPRINTPAVTPQSTPGSPVSGGAPADSGQLVDRPKIVDFSVIPHPLHPPDKEPCTVWFLRWTVNGATNLWLESQQDPRKELSGAFAVIYHPGHYQFNASNSSGAVSRSFTIAPHPATRLCD